MSASRPDGLKPVWLQMAAAATVSPLNCAHCLGLVVVYGGLVPTKFAEVHRGHFAVAGPITYRWLSGELWYLLHGDVHH